MSEFFRKFSAKTSQIVGSPTSFLWALLVITIWATSGPIFHFSNTWQLVINTGTTIITFLMVFLIQNTQNRDARAMHLKLDELINSVKGARTGLINIEELSDDELDVFREEFRKIQERYERRMAAKENKDKTDTVRISVTKITTTNKKDN